MTLLLDWSCLRSSLTPDKIYLDGINLVRVITSRTGLIPPGYKMQPML